MHIVQARLAELETVASLFDAYRQFYRQPSDFAAARAFMAERLRLQDSAVFIAYLGEIPAGFVQLYPSFSSVGMGRIYVLNDLFVAGPARKQGIATALIRHCEAFAVKQGAKRLALATETTNLNAQKLYEKLGWTRDTQFFHYGKLTH